MAVIRISRRLSCELFFRRGGDIHGRIHAKRSLRSAGSTSGIWSFGMVMMIMMIVVIVVIEIGLGSLLQSVEIGNIDAICIDSLVLHGTVDERGGIGRHVGSWRRALVPGQIRAAGFTLPLLTGGAGQAREVGLFGKDFSHSSVVIKRKANIENQVVLADGVCSIQALAKMKAECKV